MKSLFAKRGRNATAGASSDDNINNNSRKEPLIESLRSSGGDDSASEAVRSNASSMQGMLRSPPGMTNTKRQPQQQQRSVDLQNNSEDDGSMIEIVDLNMNSRTGDITIDENRRMEYQTLDDTYDNINIAASKESAAASVSPSAQLQASFNADLMAQHTTLPAYKKYVPNPLHQGEPSRSMDEEDEMGLLVSTKIPGTRLEKIRVVLFRSGLIYFLVFLVTAASMVYGVSDKFGNAVNPFRTVDWDLEISVAFIGNAYFFVNDIPRLLEAVSTGHVYQNSVLHAGGSLKALWQTGNGMYELWQTEEAEYEYNPESDTDDYNAQTTYDFGLCSVAQILQGYDEYIGYGNTYGHYKNDGLNPCIVDEYYASIVEAQLERDPVHWNFVVLADQTKRMAVEKARNDTVNVLTGGYGPFLKSSGAIPVIVDTHAFWSDSSNMTGLSDVPTFTALIWDGVAAYVDALSSLLPRKQAPLVAPIGLAYLAVWEEDYDLWQALFLEDQIHASAAGSYLFVHVLYCTLFGHMPADDYTPPQYLFQDARKILGGQPAYPSSYEAEYLRNVARRVALKGYVPPSLYGGYDGGNNNRQ